MANKARNAANSLAGNKKAATVRHDWKENVKAAECLRTLINKMTTATQFQADKAKKMSVEAAKVKMDCKQNLRIARSYKDHTD